MLNKILPSFTGHINHLRMPPSPSMTSASYSLNQTLKRSYSSPLNRESSASFSSSYYNNKSSTNSAYQNNGGSSSSGPKQSRWVWLFRHSLRALQITFISAGVFSAGYSYGLIQYASNPKAMDEVLMKQAMMSMTTKNSSKKSESATTDNDDNRGYHNTNTFEYNRVKQVSQRVITAAKMFCKTQITILQKEVDLQSKQLTSNFSQQQQQNTAPSSRKGWGSTSQSMEKASVSKDSY